MSIQQNFPAISPSLNLNFARSKTLDPRITFSRTSTATRVNEQGLVEVVSADIPRFDHKYENGVIKSLGLLVEEGRSNLVTQNSTDFNYSINNQIIATQLDIAPDGNSVLCKHDLTGATSPFLNCRANTTLSAGQTYTMSMWLKGTTSFSASFAFVGESPSEIYANTANITTSWQRFTLTFTLVNTQTSSRLQVFFAQQGEGKVISIWGAQLEQGAFVTSYIPRPVAGQQSTRNPDSVSMTGDNFSDWYNPTEWTLMIAARRNYGGNFLTFPNLARINDGTNNNNVGFYGAQGSTQFTNFGVGSGGVNQTPYVAINVPTTSQFKMIQALKENDSTFGVNGTLTTTDTSVLMPVGVNQLLIGVGSWGGTIQQLIYYPVRLPNSILQSLTK